jgi:hypothetical protein
MGPMVVRGKSKHRYPKRSAIMASRALKIDSKKDVTSEAIDSAELKTSEAVDERAIAALAYEIWLDRGCPIGTDQEDWFRAEEDLKKLAKTATTVSGRR